ncbi:hypothetical protein B0H16DRAFT_1454791 [Mycena metata]|uniref:Uncharacterized protein n=1 Tax=Mycena metata TaxID=1033252 RepID=A0AAD7NJY5_9AGAR|nr:hypothetical protein B0H16DRAFT_1454791 [Mycena metata]
MFGGFTNNQYIPARSKLLSRSFGDLWELRIDEAGGHFDEVNVEEEMRSAKAGPWQRCFSELQGARFLLWRGMFEGAMEGAQDDACLPESEVEAQEVSGWDRAADVTFLSKGQSHHIGALQARKFRLRMRWYRYTLSFNDPSAIPARVDAFGKPSVYDQPAS